MSDSDRDDDKGTIQKKTMKMKIVLKMCSMKQMTYLVTRNKTVLRLGKIRLPATLITRLVSLNKKLLRNICGAKTTGNFCNQL